jgi:hypothetical protein
LPRARTEIHCTRGRREKVRDADYAARGGAPARQRASGGLKIRTLLLFLQ